MLRCCGGREVKKNCHYCEHLEYGFGDVGDSEGFICNKKDYYNENEESKMIDKMSRDSYLDKSKVCFVLREVKNE